MNHLEKIEEIKNHPDVKIAGVDKGKDLCWKHYFDVIGWYKGNYFRVLFSKFENNEPKIKVSKETDEREQFIKDFGLCH